MIPSPALPVLSLLPLLCCAGSAYGESRLEFVDLRLQGGLVESVGAGGAITLMCGNIGEKSSSGEEPGDTGIVIGVRAGACRVRADDGNSTFPAQLATIGPVAGLGYFIDKRNHLELCAGWAYGFVTLPQVHSGFSGNDGRSTTWSGELGWYHTWKKGLQLGLLGGWSSTTINCYQDTPAAFTAASYGVNLAAVLGYRF